MNGKWNATKSIILQVERNHRASFYCQKNAGTEDNFTFFSESD